MRKKLRETGIALIGSAPWGTHFCQFYQSKEDLLEILVPYFKAGLENNEFCMWITSEPLGVEEADTKLRKVVKNLTDYFKKGQIEILDYSQWYTKSGKFDADEVLAGWIEKENQALERGFDGLRLSGNTFWLEDKEWRGFTNYEEAINGVIGNYKMLALCSYALDKCRATEIMDIVANHQFAIVKREHRWEIIENSDRKQAEEELKKRENLLQKIFDVLPVGLWFADKDGKLLRGNPAGVKIWGAEPKVDPSEYGVFKARRLPSGEEIAPEDWALAHTVRERVTVVDEMLEIEAFDGKKKVILNYTAPVLDDQGAIQGAIVVNLDITDLKRAEEKIQASLLEKETMLKEIHHRVKNNLQVILSLLNLQSSYLQDEKAREALRESMARVRTMGIIHTQLYQSQDLVRVDCGLFIRDLIGNISQSYGRAAFLVEINVDADEIGLDLDTSIPCGLILNELVTNALKHAFPEGKEGEINIRMRSEDNRVVLTVQDNGIGFPESINLTNVKSMGLELVNILVGQMNGKIDMQVDGGTTWTITFSIKNERDWRNG